MDLQNAANRLKQLFTDHRYAMQEDNETKANSIGNEYRILRAFCIEFNIFTFTEMERLEYECIQRMDKIHKQNQLTN